MKTKPGSDKIFWSYVEISKLCKIPLASFSLINGGPQCSNRNNYVLIVNKIQNSAISRKQTSSRYQAKTKRFISGLRMKAASLIMQHIIFALSASKRLHHESERFLDPTLTVEVAAGIRLIQFRTTRLLKRTRPPLQFLVRTTHRIYRPAFSFTNN